MSETLEELHSALSEQVSDMQKLCDALDQAIAMASKEAEQFDPADRIAIALDADIAALEHDAGRFAEAVWRFRHAVQCGATAMTSARERSSSALETAMQKFPEAADDVQRQLRDAAAALENAFEESSSSISGKLDEACTRIENMLSAERERLQHRMDQISNDVGNAGDRVRTMVARLDSALSSVLVACRGAGYGLGSAASALKSATQAFGQVA